MAAELLDIETKDIHSHFTILVHMLGGCRGRGGVYVQLKLPFQYEYCRDSDLCTRVYSYVISSFFSYLWLQQALKRHEEGMHAKKHEKTLKPAKVCLWQRVMRIDKMG